MFEYPPPPKGVRGQLRNAFFKVSSIKPKFRPHNSSRPNRALKQCYRPDKYVHESVLWIRFRMFSDLPDPDPSLFVFAWIRTASAIVIKIQSASGLTQQRTVRYRHHPPKNSVQQVKNNYKKYTG